MVYSSVDIDNHEHDHTSESRKVLLVNESGNPINNSNPIDIAQVGLSGASTNGTSALTGANTWVQVPTSAPVSDYVLVVTKENEDGVIRWSFENGGTPSSTNGNRMWNDNIIFTLKGGEVVYFASSTDGDDVNWATKII